GIPQVVKVRNYSCEGVRALVPAIENVDLAERVVGTIVHIGDKDAMVGRDSEEANAAETLDSNIDRKLRGKVQGERPPVSKADWVRSQLFSRQNGRDHGKQK